MLLTTILIIICRYLTDITITKRRLKSDQEELRGKIKSLQALCDRNIRTIQRISSDIRPGILDHLGLSAAVEWLVQDFAGRTEISCQCQIKPSEIIIERGITTAVFRILQEALREIAVLKNKPPVLVLSIYPEQQYALRALRAGAGNTDLLSNREYEVLVMMAKGKKVREIAQEMTLSPKTISTYRERLLQKLKMRSTSELIYYAIRNGLVD